MVDLFYEYIYFYQKYAIAWWNHVGPAEYVTMLTVVGVLGYLMMLKGPKRIA